MIYVWNILEWLARNVGTESYTRPRIWPQCIVQKVSAVSSMVMNIYCNGLKLKSPQLFNALQKASQRCSWCLGRGFRETSWHTIIQGQRQMTQKRLTVSNSILNRHLSYITTVVMPQYGHNLRAETYKRIKYIRPIKIIHWTCQEICL